MLINEEFFNLIFPSKKIIKYKPKVNYDSNNVIFKNILLFGSQGVGKTTSVNSITKSAIDKYGKKNINAKVSEDGDIQSLMLWGLRPTLVNILFADNATLRKQDRQVLMNYFKIRHLFKDRFKLSNGYILSIISVHRFFSVPVELRCNMEGILFKDTSLNPYDRNFIKRFIGSESLQFLDEIARGRDKNPGYKRFSIFVSRGLTGLVSLPLTKENYLSSVLDLDEIIKYLDRR